MNRRKFIVVGLLGAGSAVLGIYALDFKRAVKQMLTDDSKKLNIDPSSIDQFVLDADNELFWKNYSTSKRILICIQHFFHRLGIHLPFHEKYIQYRNMITGQFLLSTDFFSNKMDVSKKVSYVGFFNPYKTPCSNPFSNLRFRLNS